MTASRTSLGRATRIDKNNQTPCFLGFIFDRVYPLPEGPRAHHAVKALAAPRARANAVQSLQDDNWIVVARCQVHNLATDLVVDVSHPTAFLATPRLHSVQAVVLLVTPAEIGKVFLWVANGFAVKELNGVRCANGRQAYDSEINTDERGFTVPDGRCVIVDTQGEHHIPVPVTLKEFGVAVDILHPFVPFGRHTKGQSDVMTTLSGGATQMPAPVLLGYGIRGYTQTDSLTTVHLGKGGVLLIFAKSIVGAPSETQALTAIRA